MPVRLPPKLPIMKRVDVNPQTQRVEIKNKGIQQQAMDPVTSLSFQYLDTLQAMMR